MNTELMTRNTIAELVAAWNQSEREITQAYALLAGCERRLKSLFEDTYRFDLGSYGHHHTIRYAEPEGILADLKKDIWSCLIDRMEVRRVLSVKRAEELNKALESGKMEDGSPLPDITEEHVLNMMKSFLTNIDTFMHQAVGEVFNFLRPHGSEYKTNTEFEVGKRVILGWRVERRYGQPGFRVSYHGDAQIRALDNVFHLLDGVGPVKTHNGQLHDAIEKSVDGKGETDYFKFKCYGNRNLHLEFKRLDLVQKLNAIAGGMNLKPTNGKEE